ncbi:HAD superfamily hydrolase (TIGR01509 family) [Rhizomicrobium palustre]|uniref:HAD superfamily hydrolase (TIGR01509 family) n=2 Tax=Rhizomicrobium palustre TaxID=189966 RepID=A0A846MZ30_9PROT|nr:HAD superfamily hydrolase (TIGR01509 family) [Rhizomicrobium palustre]
MDGVITDTASLHAAAWKEMFDDFLEALSGETGTPFSSFTQSDYLAYVDGRPRYDGVRAFLASRGIALADGEPSDLPGSQSVCALGNRKDQAFNQSLDTREVSLFASTMAFIEALRARQVKLGVATSSKNGVKILQKAGVLDLFETRVDGVTAAEMGLQGKPAPDIFAIACERLGVMRHRTVVVEDAVSGVAAGARGRFGLTIGIAREDNREELKRRGADMVVSDLSEITLGEIDHWFEHFVRTRPGAPDSIHSGSISS